MADWGDLGLQSYAQAAVGGAQYDAEHGGGAAATPDAEVAAMGRGDRIRLLLERTVPKVPGEIGDQIRQLLTPAALHVIEGVVALWLVSHFFGFGEVFDALVLATGVVALGADAVHATRLAMGAFTDAASATTAAAIDGAAGRLANAIGIIGIDMLATLLFRWKRTNVPHQIRIADFPRAPDVAPGTWRYTPKRYAYPFPASYGDMQRSAGFATPYGDIHINTRYPLTEQQITLFHEQFHTLLRPKLDILRRLRAQWTVNSYNNSYLTRFFEEAFAEGSAQMRADGFSFGRIVEGFSFPLNGQYRMTFAKVAQEAGEVLLGPIKIDNDIYYGALARNDRAPRPAAQSSPAFGDAFKARTMTSGRGR